MGRRFLVFKIYKMPVALEDVLSIRKSIDKIVETGEGDQEMELLKRLAKIEMNLQILTKTKIGYSVHALKKSSKNDETISKAKSLIKSWRKFVPEENPKSSIGKGNQSQNSTKSNKMDTAKSSKSSSNVDVNGTYVYDGSVLEHDEEVRKRDGYMESIPRKNFDGVLIFKDQKEFRPNMTPKEVLQAGSFGGTYFRPIKSSVTGLKYNKMWEELPQNWLENLNIKKMVASTNYDEKVNTYKVKCGGSLEMWESSGWMSAADPYGWFQWYCRFYLGRRSEDDERQIGRWNRAAGPTGRFRLQLINKCVKAETSYKDSSVSPVIRQTLQHWAYTLTEKDYKEGKKRVKM